MSMMRKLFCLAAILATTTLVSLPAFASSSEDEAPVNARMLGYEKDLSLPESNIMVVFLIWTGLAAAGIGAMFKNAKRTHLD
jgi:hypothetical protein